MRAIVVSLSFALTGLLVAAGPAAALAPTQPRVDALTHSMVTARSGAATVALQDGRVLIVAGQAGKLGGFYTDEAELYDPGADPVAGTFADLGHSGFASADPFGVLLDDGDALIGGGIGGGDARRFTAPATFTPLTGKSPLTSRNGSVAARLPDGSVLIAGGSWVDTAETFDPGTNTFNSSAAKLGIARAYAGAASLPDGRILIVGGSDGSAAHDTAEIFDPVTATFFTLASKMSIGRTGPVVAALPDGKVLVAGGGSSYSCGGTPATSAEVFDPADEAFHPLATPLAVGRCAPSAAALKDGTVLVAGGLGASAWLSSAERYVPSPSASVTGAVFDGRPVGDPSLEKAITVRNYGAQDLEIGSGALAITGAAAGDYTLLAETCTGRTLVFKESCTVVARFTPSAAGSRSATIQLDTNEPQQTAIALTGEGFVVRTHGDPPFPPVTPTVPATPSGATVIKPQTTPTCKARRVKGRTRITCPVRFPKLKRKAIKLQQGRKVFARGKVDGKGRVTLTTFLRPKAGTYRLRVGTTSVVVKLR